MVQIEIAFMNEEHPVSLFNPYFLFSGVAAYHWKAVLLELFSCSLFCESLL